jgi:threonylcarbamoyladenosine tRNA methylthiotransferase MtaB
MLGKEQTVLVEKFNKKTGFAKGYGEHYLPVEFRALEDLHNQFVKVRLESLSIGTDPVIYATVPLF